MRIAVFSDMHGNLTAMNAVLKDIESHGYDQIICLGDVTAVGPQPAETLAKVRTLECPMIMGNHDEWLLTQNDVLLVPDNDRVDGMLFRVIRDIDAWCRDQLSEDDLDYISSFLPTYNMMIDEVEVLFYHGSPRSNHDMLVATTPSDEVELMIAGNRHAVMIGGHSHLQMIRRHYDKLMVNVGSIGAPFYFNNQGDIRNPWWAEYGIITIEPNFTSVDLRRVMYDVDEALQRLDESDMPHKDWYIKARDRLSR